MTVEQGIIIATGVGYVTVGILQLTKGSIPNAMIWIGYAVAQCGLLLNLKV